MKRFVFQLAKVLEFREYRERIAKAALAEKSGRCALLEQELADNARTTLLASGERFKPGGNVADFLAAEHYAWRLASEREHLIKTLAAAELEQETARHVYLAARQASEIILKLKEREEASYYKAASREEVKTMDDIAAMARAHGSRSAFMGGS
jgi:flagellar export protein FliJ